MPIRVIVHQPKQLLHQAKDGQRHLRLKQSLEICGSKWINIGVLYDFMGYVCNRGHFWGETLVLYHTKSGVLEDPSLGWNACPNMGIGWCWYVGIKLVNQHGLSSLHVSDATKSNLSNGRNGMSSVIEGKGNWSGVILDGTRKPVWTWNRRHFQTNLVNSRIHRASNQQCGSRLTSFEMEVYPNMPT